MRRLLCMLVLGSLTQPAWALKKTAQRPGANPVAKKPGAPAKRPILRLKTPPRAKAPAPKNDVERLGRGYSDFLDGDYPQVRKDLEPIDLARLHNRDYALYLLAQAELLSGEPAGARAHFQQLSAMPSRFQSVARFRMADADWALGKKAEAARAYESLLASASEQIETAVPRFRIAQAAEERGAKDAAIAAYRKVWTMEPLHPLAADALERLKALGAPEPSAPERIARAKVMTGSRAWTRALEELALLPGELPPQVRDEADYWWATTKFKMRRDYDQAAQKLLGLWERLPGDDRKAEALFHGARARSRADDDDGAIEGYKQVVQRFPRSRFAPEASFLIGWLDFNRGRYAQAIPSLEDTLRRYGGTQWNDDARWYLGFSRWLAGDTTGALADFDKLSKLPGALSGGKGSYWAGRALDKLGRADEALARWRALVGQYPFSYYATEARVRLKDKGIALGPFGDGKPGQAQPLRELEPALEKDPLILRVDELLSAGLTVEAGVELRRGEGELLRRYGPERALPLLIDRYQRGEDFHRPHQLAESWSGGALQRDPQSDPNARRWWEVMYPRAYRAFVEKYAPTGDNPPYYLYTIMQKESAYNPHDVSYADAIGLLQMIPPTSRRVSERIDRPYTDDVLYDPEGNIQFGAWYIGHLLGKFKKQIPIGAGSYNAGPKAMMKWLKLNGARPLDEFIELCSYTQTREYMKKVVDIYARYVWLYAKEDYLPDTQIDPEPVVDDGIDY